MDTSGRRADSVVFEADLAKSRSATSLPRVILQPLLATGRLSLPQIAAPEKSAS